MLQNAPRYAKYSKRMSKRKKDLKWPKLLQNVKKKTQRKADIH